MVEMEQGVELPDPATPVDDQALSAVGHSMLVDTIKALPDRDRLVVELGLVEGLPYVEIAMILDVPVGTVKSRMFAARSKLVKNLSERGISR